MITSQLPQHSYSKCPCCKKDGLFNIKINQKVRRVMVTNIYACKYCGVRVSK